MPITVKTSIQAAFLLTAGAFSSARAQSGPFFERVLHPDTGATLRLMSADGSALVSSGWSKGGTSWYLWRRETGFQTIPPYYTGYQVDFADINANGTVLIGTASLSGPRDVIYRTATGYDKSFGFYTFGKCISDDGLTTAIDGKELFPHVIVHSPRGGVTLYDDFSWLRAEEVSGDGLVVFGSFDQQSVWRSVDLGQHEAIPELQSATHSAAAASFDGSVLVGTRQQHGAYRWEESVGLQLLGTLPDGRRFTEATGVSGDGLTMVGAGVVTDASEAVIWNANHGLRSVRSLLADRGLDEELEGWTFTNAVSISRDARIVCGRGLFMGEQATWIASFGPACAADWNDDGARDSSDFFEFLNDFFCEGKDCRGTDFNADGVENSSDYFEFLVAFFAGCP
jgi:hypothetical protein